MRILCCYFSNHYRETEGEWRGKAIETEENKVLFKQSIPHQNSNKTDLFQFFQFHSCLSPYISYLCSVHLIVAILFVRFQMKILISCFVKFWIIFFFLILYYEYVPSGYLSMSNMLFIKKFNLSWFSSITHTHHLSSKIITHHQNQTKCIITAQGC